MPVDAVDPAERERERRLSEVLGAYFEAIEAGQAADVPALIARNPDLAADLRDFFAHQSRFDRMVQPLRGANSSVLAGAVAAGEEPPILMIDESAVSHVGLNTTVAKPSTWGEGHPKLPIRLHGETASVPPGTRLRYFGDYELLEEIGCGGMGVVFRARQRSLNRLVAVKMIRAGHWASEDDVRRFGNEAEAVANLDHRNIVPIYEVGAHEGRHYFSMKLIDGRSLSQRLSEVGSDLHAVARLVKQVALAVHHAHQRGILHRDLKPSNILLDAEGEPHVTDFGLAKRVTEDGEPSQSASIIGTPAYMAPEQAAGRKGAITTATDVYGLGAVLYTILTGRAPFSGSSVIDILMQVRERTPEPPSGLNKRVDRDLETICMKCLEHDPKQRYGSAEALANELQRWLNHEPIEARPVGTAERLWRWCQRNAAVAALTAVALTLLVAVAVISTAAAIGYNALANREHATATREIQARERAAIQAEQNRWRLVRMNVVNGVRLMDRGEALSSLAWFAEAYDLDRTSAAADPMHRYRLASLARACPQLLDVWSHDGTVNHAEFSPDGRRVVTASDDGTARVWDVETGAAVTPPLRHTDLVLTASFSPDGRLVLTASEDGTACLWEASSGRPSAPLLRHGGHLRSASFSPDGKLVATASTDGDARLWDTATGTLHGPVLHHGGRLSDATFSPDGRLLATSGDDRSTRLWNVGSGTQSPARPLRHEALVRQAAFSPDSRRVVTASSDNTARVWNAATGAPIGLPLKHALWVFHVAFSPDGRWILTASHDGSARVWDAQTGNPISNPMRHKVAVRHAEFSPDGLRVVTAGWDGSAIVWDAATGDSLTPALTLGDKLMHVAFSPDGHRIVASSCDRAAHVWELAGTGLNALSVDHGAGLNDAAFSPDGRRFATAGGDGAVRIWDATTGASLTPAMKHVRGVLSLAFSPDGRLIATASFDGTARVWDSGTGKPVTPPFKHTGIIRHIEFSPDGRRVATASEDGTARVWDARTGSAVTPPLTHRGSVWHVTFSPDGRVVATASSDSTAGLWDAETGAARTPPLEHPSVVDSVRFSPDGRHVATACSDTSLAARNAQVWDVATGKPVGPPLRHGDGVECVAFSADGTRIVTSSEDQTARVWDAATGRPITPPIVHGHTVAQAWFSPDGRRIATGCWGDGTARVWDATTGEPLTPPMRHGGKLRVVSFSPDGRRLLTAGDNGLAQIWDLPQDNRPAADLVLRARLLSSHFIDSTGGMVALDPAYVRTGWERMRKYYPDDMTPPPFSAITGWHRHEAERAERRANWHAAVWNLERLAARDPQDASVHLRLGQAQAELRDWKAAAASFTSALEKGSNDPAVVLWRGWAHAHLNQTDRALADLERAADHAPHDATVWLALFFVRGERSEWEQAEADWSRALRTRPAPTAAQCRILLAHLSAAIEEGHDGWWVWRARAFAREVLDQWQEAAADYRENVERKSDDWRGWNGRAWALRKLKRWDESLASYSKAIELQPRAPHLWGMRGDTQAIIGQWDKAADDFARWAELGGENEAIPWHHHACLRLFAGDVEGYRHACKRLIDRWGGSTDSATLALVVRTCVLHPAGTDDPDRLVRMAEGLAAANRRKGLPLFLLGAAKYRAGALEQAAERLEDSVEADPAWRATHLSGPLAVLAHQRLGETARAEHWSNDTEQWFHEVSDKIAHTEPPIPPSPWYEWLEFQILRKEVDGPGEKSRAIPP